MRAGLARAPGGVGEIERLQEPRVLEARRRPVDPVAAHVRKQGGGNAVPAPCFRRSGQRRQLANARDPPVPVTAPSMVIQLDQQLQPISPPHLPARIRFLSALLSIDRPH